MSRRRPMAKGPVPKLEKMMVRARNVGAGTLLDLAEVEDKPGSRGRIRRKGGRKDK